ncbi:hypothetical protein V6N12_045741 [Hibiscus sabdariffa]|uniref:Uncharacterized protein n=1 Tax=Hibiscus sabdariffa TaxID=183260 RepID=A0ABR2G4D2_9ROSI
MIDEDLLPIVIKLTNYEAIEPPYQASRGEGIEPLYQQIENEEIKGCRLQMTTMTVVTAVTTVDECESAEPEGAVVEGGRKEF